MPNRILKESIRISDSIDRLSWFEEVLFYRLIVSCDDYGRYDGRPAIIKNMLFPLKENLTLQTVTKAINNLASAELVVLYEFEGKPYLYLPGWNEHQAVRAKKSKFPAPEDGVITHEIICKHMQADESKCLRNPIQSNPNPKAEAVDECAHARMTPPPPRSRAVDVFMKKITPTPSSASMYELLDFERELGTDVCLRAIDEALDNNARSWQYVKAILRAKEEQGVRSLADWDRLEAQRMDAKARRTAQQQAEEAPPVDVGDIDLVLREMEGANNEKRPDD